MLRLIAVSIPTSHNEQFLCSDRDGNPRFSDTGYGFTKKNSKGCPNYSRLAV